MTHHLIRLLRNFQKTDDGVTLVEYGIALTLAIAIGTAVLLALSGAVGTKMNAATTTMTGP